MNPIEANADQNPVYDPGVQQLSVQLAQVLTQQIIPPDWDRAEVVIKPVEGGLQYTVLRGGDPSANLNVNLAFHLLAQQLLQYWAQRWGRSMPRVAVEVSPGGGWQVGFFVDPGMSLCSVGMAQGV